MDSDFYEQSEIIKNRFLQKGYTAQLLKEIIQEVGSTPRQSCLMDKEHQDNLRQDWGFISNFHGQYKEIVNIFRWEGTQFW